MKKLLSLLILLLLQSPVAYIYASSSKDPKKKAKIMKSIYKQDYQFPGWNIGYINSSCWGKDSKKVTAYAMEGANKNLLKKLIKEREPVNIAINTHFNQKQASRGIWMASKCL